MDRRAWGLIALLVFAMGSMAALSWTMKEGRRASRVLAEMRRAELAAKEDQHHKLPPRPLDRGTTATRARPNLDGTTTGPAGAAVAALSPPPELLTSGTSAVEGHVFLSPAGEAAPGARVFLKVVSAPTVPADPQATGARARGRGPSPTLAAVADDLGAFRFAALPPGDYLLTATHQTTGPPARRWGMVAPRPRTVAADPPASGSLPVAVPAGLAVRLGASESTSGLELHLTEGLTLSGRVLDRRTRKGLGGVAVSVKPARGSPATLLASGESDADGSYRLTGLFPSPAAAPFLVATLDGWSQDDLRASAGEPVLLDPARPENHRDILMVAQTTVAGTVVDRDGAPVAGAKVDAYLDIDPIVADDLPTTTTGADGRFRLPATPRAPMVVRATATGLGAAMTAPLSIPDHFVDGLVLKLPGGADLTGVVVLPDGKPAVGAAVVARFPIGFGQMGEDVAELARATADGEGRFILPNLSPEYAWIYASLTGFGDADPAIPIPRSANLGGWEPLRLQLHQSHWLAGRVGDSTSTPLEGVQVTLNYAGERGIRRASTDFAGRFRFDGLRATLPTVVLTSADHGIGWWQKQPLDRENVYDLNNTQGTILGLVVDGATSEPIADFRAGGRHDGHVEYDPDHAGVFTVRFDNSRRTGGALPLIVEASGYAPQHHAVEPTNDSSLNGVFHKTYVLHGGGALRGRVLEAGTSRPLSGLTVVATRPPYEPRPDALATTDEGGRFELAGVPTGKNKLIVRRADSSRLLEADGMVSAVGQVHDLGDLTAHSPRRLTACVVGEPGDIPVAHVQLTSAGDWTGEIQTNSTGPDGCALFEIKNVSQAPFLDAAALRVRFRPPPTPAESTIPQDQRAVLRLGQGSVRGKVISSGRPVAVNATLDSDSPLVLKHGYWTRFTDPLAGRDGRYVFDQLPAGPCVLRVHARDDYNNSVTVTLNLAAAEQRVQDIELPTAL